MREGAAMRDGWWTGWRGVALLALALGAARVVYLVWLCPYELIEDEAHYWEWSRRLAGSYYTKGPGVAWVIAGSTSLFGAHEWSVRLPTVIAGLVTMLAVAGLAMDVARDRRAGLWAAALWALAPAHLALGLLMTIDGPYIACWALAAWAGWRALSRTSGGALVAFALAMGVGFLFKYTILLLGVGVAMAWLFEARARKRAGDARAGIGAGWWLAALVVFVGAISPVIVWNAARGWPTVAHLLHHLERAPAPASAPTSASPGWTPLWAIEFLGAQWMLGPALALIMLEAWRAFRARRAPLGAGAVQPASGDRGLPEWPGARYLLCCAAPILLFYLSISLFNDAEGNWPLGGYTTLFALAGAAAPARIDHYKALVADWRSRAASARERPRMGVFRRKPETAFQVLAHWTIGVGIVAGLGMLRLDWLARAPLVGGLIPMYRFDGARERARVIDARRAELREREGREPALIAQHYGPASHLAFYLPDRPTVRCARSRVGGEPSAYDFFPDTRLDDPALTGATAILVGGDAPFWAAAFARVEEAGFLDERDRRRAAAGRPSKYRLLVGREYHGWPTTPGSGHAGRAAQ